MVSVGTTRMLGMRAVWLAALLVGLVLLPAATASHTPNPASVTIAGSLQSEAGCPGDWDPACATTHLAYDASDDVWQGTFALPPGSYEYKAALNDAWDENYGLHAQQGGDNIPLNLASGTSVKFYYDHKSHWVTDNQSSVIAVAPGSFQSELGCPGDWDPGCLRSWLEDPDGDGTYTFETTRCRPARTRRKVAINEAWDENYGQGGVPGGDNIAFTVPAAGTTVTFSYVASTHVLTVTVAASTNRRSLALRPRPQGLRRHRAQHDLEGLVHGRGRHAQRRLLPDGRQHERRDAPVRRHRRLDVHRPAGARHDLQRRGGRRQRRHGLQGHGDREERRVPDRDHYVTDPGRNVVLMKVDFKPKPKKKGPVLRLYVRFDPTVNGNGGGGAGNGGADSATVDTSTGHPVLVASDPVTATNAANRDYAQPVYAALDGPFTEGSSGFVGTPSDGLVQLDASHVLDPPTPDATDGNVVQTAQVALGHDGKTELALGFGATQSEAVGAAEGSLERKFDKTLGDYRKGWKEYDKSLRKPPKKLAGIKGKTADELEDAYYVSANVLKASEDKTFPGAIVASLASPWGQAISAGDPANTYFGSYREVFARDLYEAWTGLVADGDLATARDATLFLFERQQLPDGSMPRNSLVNGKLAPDSFGTQLDETAYPILMAQQLGLTDAALYSLTSSPRRTSSPRTGRRSASSAGRSRAATRPRRSRPRSPASQPPPTSRARTATRRRRRSGSASPTTGSARSRAGR